ncbi:hypothetical protein SWZG_00265 [Synechococcus phage S-SKS1]|uniref:Uncharacterized protein n=1 Tax=Synechococcus phage S-SKS1 TaxID=754042 RepID=M4QQ26_9CAUD|nr:hypothetical protein SWZG_00265 [Synechococcus phage S-SKS1]AGH31770.1 hypothetical protein SWZG_00265 [Synechococcus phage S-SKS1]
MAPLPADYKQTEEKSFKGTESGRNVLESNAKYTTTADQGSNPASKPTVPGINTQKIRKSSKFGPLRYPNKEIHKNTDYLQIDVLQYKPLGLDLTKKEIIR